MELHHPIMSKLWDLRGQTKRKRKKSTSGVSFTRDDESLMEGADGKLEEEEERRGWETVAWRHRRRIGRKARSRGQGGSW